MAKLKPSQRLYRIRNKLTRCEVGDCPMRRHSSSQYCANHARRSLAYGHPDGHPVTKKQLAPYHKQAKAFLKQHKDHKATLTAVQILDELLRRGTLMAAEDPDEPVFRELRRLSDLGLTGAEALEVLCAVWLYARYEPRSLPDDMRLTFALSRAFLQTRPQSVRQSSWCWGKERRAYHKPGASVHRDLGQLLRDRLGIFFINMVKALDAEAERQRTQKRQLAEPFENWGDVP